MTAVQSYDLGGVSSAEWLLVETDQSIEVGINSQTNLISVGSVLLMGKTGITSLYFQNLSTNTQAVVQVLAVD